VTDIAGQDAPPLVSQILPSGLDQVSAKRAGELSHVAAQEGAIKGASRTPHDLRASRNPGDILLRALTTFAALTILAASATMIIVLAIQSWPSMSKFGLSFLVGSDWGPTSFGAFPAIAGTMYTSLGALAAAVSVGVLIAIFLSEISPQGIRLPLGFLVELLAAVPSIVYGLWAVFVLVPLVLNYIEPFFEGHFGGFFLFANPSLGGYGILPAIMVLSVMILPTIAAISRDVLMAVPNSQREAMLALGATRWETTWKVVIPYARAGIIGGIMLGLGRGVGETMAVQLVIGTSPQTGFGIFSQGTTMPANIVNRFPDATGLGLAAILELSLLLLVITIALNAGARALVWSVTRKYSQ
jgi:phosphate transport system permease protein